MSQDWSASSDSGSRDVDFALAIPGWPAVLTVAGTYGLPESGPLSVAAGFAPNTSACLSRPRASRSQDRRRPEDGVGDRQQIELDLIDPGTSASQIPKSLPVLGRRAILWKGRQNLDLGSWAEAFIGVISGFSRLGPRLVLSISDSTWLFDEGGEKRLHADYLFRNARVGPFESAGALNYWDSISPPDLRVTVEDSVDGSVPLPPLGNGRYLLCMQGSWFGIEGALNVTSAYGGPST